MKREHVNQIYSKIGYVNLVWIRIMESDPNKIQITNFLRETDFLKKPCKLVAANKYVINMNDGIIKNKDLRRNIVMAENESRMFNEFMSYKRNKEIYGGLLYNRILQPHALIDNGFYIWLNNNDEKQIISIARVDNTTNKVVCEDGSQINESTIEAVIDEDTMYKFNMKIICTGTLFGMLTTKTNVDRLKESYINNYPSLTVGKLLDNVFTNSKWSDYEENGVQFVNYNANYNEHYIRVVFIVYDNDNFDIGGLYVDGYNYSSDIVDFMNTLYYYPQLLKDNIDNRKR